MGHHLTALTPLAALTLGLLGSVAHCVGMCGGVVMLLGRSGVQSPAERLAAHAGRVTTYALLGALAGGLGQALFAVGQAQGVVALVLAVFLLYMAAAVVGVTPPVERYAGGLSRLWQQQARRALALPRRGVGRAWLLGMLWGLLPCGFVYTVLLAAAATASPLSGSVTALAFGAGTLPALEGTRTLLSRLSLRGRQVTRWASSVLLVLLAAQMTMRGLAAWGLVDHGRVGGIMLW